MRCLYLIFAIVPILFSVSDHISAQDKKGTVHAVSRQDMLTKLPVDVAYWVEDFAEAKIFYANGTQTTALVNICTVDNTVRYINDKGDTLIMGNSSSVSRILVGEMLFVRHKDKFYKEIVRYGSCSLAEQRIFNFTEPEIETNSGYGMAPTSTAKKSNIHSVDYDRTYEFEADIPWNLKISYVLIDRDKIYLAKRSSFEKIFSEKKEFIRTFVKLNDTDFDKKQDVVSLFWYCAEN